MKHFYFPNPSTQLISIKVFMKRVKTKLYLTVSRMFCRQHLSPIFRTNFLLYCSTLIFLASCESESYEKTLAENTIRIMGSDTEFKMVEALSQSFSKQNYCTFELSGEGTSTGIQALINGEANIANCSREMTYDEIREAERHGIKPVPAIIALDAIAFISNPYNKVDSLSTIQIKGILSGEINNWKQVGGLDRKIILCGRNENSGTYEFLKDRYVKDSGFASSTKRFSRNQQIVDAVIKDTFAIGYVGAGFIMDAKGKPNSQIWAMYIYTDGESGSYSPYETMAVIRGDYPLVRPLYQYFNGLPAGQIRTFLKFELSKNGQKIIREHGFFPLTSQMEQQNYRNGIVF